MPIMLPRTLAAKLILQNIFQNEISPTDHITGID
jgi:hypothetical protein